MYGVFLAIGDRRERARARAVVERERGFRLVGEAGDGATAFAMIRDIQPDVVIAERACPSWTARRCGAAFAGASRGWNRSSWARATTRCSPAR